MKSVPDVIRNKNVRKEHSLYACWLLHFYLFSLLITGMTCGLISCHLDIITFKPHVSKMLKTKGNRSWLIAEIFFACIQYSKINRKQSHDFLFFSLSWACFGLEHLSSNATNNFECENNEEKNSPKNPPLFLRFTFCVILFVSKCFWEFFCMLFFHCCCCYFFKRT